MAIHGHPIQYMTETMREKFGPAQILMNSMILRAAGVFHARRRDGSQRAKLFGVGS